MTSSDAGNFAMYTKGTVSQHLWESIHCVLLVTDVWIHSARSKSRTGLLFLHHMVWFVKTCFSGKFAKRVQGQSLGGSWCNGSRYSLIYSSLGSHCSFEMEIIFRETFVLGNVKIWLKNLQSFFFFISLLFSDPIEVKCTLRFSFETSGSILSFLYVVEIW